MSRRHWQSENRRNGSHHSDATSNRRRSSSTERIHRSQVQRRDSFWLSSVKYSEQKCELSIVMSGWELDDDSIKEWCAWFKSYSQRLPGRPDEIVARDVNVAENRLTGRGVESLLRTLFACSVFVVVLKLHHNHLEDCDAIANYIGKCGGSLRELHLSHNYISTSAAADIVVASAAAKDDDGDFCYPCQASNGQGLSPLWLRLEQNYISPSDLSKLLVPEFEALGRGGAMPICTVSSKACTPHSCARHRSDVPVIHAKHLSNQRAKPLPRPEVVKVHGDVAPSRDEMPEPSTEEDDDFSSVVMADVLRWDDDLFRWVQDVIEIPELEPDADEANGRFKISSELGHKMGNELKNILRRPSHEDPQAAESRHRLSTGSSRSSRRGSQPLSSDLKQTNLTPLNPQAVEFFPTASSVVKVSRPDGEAWERGSRTSSKQSEEPAMLNPRAQDFRPASSSSSKPAAEPMPQRMGGISETLKLMARSGATASSPSSSPQKVIKVLRNPAATELSPSQSGNGGAEVPTATVETLISAGFLEKKSDEAIDGRKKRYRILRVQKAGTKMQFSVVDREGVESAIDLADADVPKERRKSSGMSSTDMALLEKKHAVPGDDSIRWSAATREQKRSPPKKVNRTPSPPGEPEPEAEVAAEKISSAAQRWLDMDSNEEQSDRACAEGERDAAKYMQVSPTPPSAAAEPSMGSVFRRALTATSAVLALGAGTAAMARMHRK